MLIEVLYECTFFFFTYIKQNEEDTCMTFSTLFLKIQSGIISTIPPTEELVTATLQKVYVAQSKDNFSAVEKGHSVVGVCQIFGCFVKFVVTMSSDAAVVVQVSKRRREESNEPIEVSNGGIPSKVKERNGKDKLNNEILTCLSTMGLSWKNPDEYGKPFVQDLCKVLWYIDGHHEVFASRSCPIPNLFSRFVGFNKPELSKHRKRSVSNLSRDRIDEFASMMQNYTMSSWMQQEEWAPFKQNLLKLVESLASYSAYLTMKNKVMKAHHASPEPVSSFEDSCCLKYIAPTSSISPLLTDIDQALDKYEFYQPLSVKDFSPKEKRRLYLFIRELEQGLSKPMFLLTYSHGSNVGNYHFIWKVPESLHSEACSLENARIIGEIKKQIPVYHTRAMRQQFCDMFGKISPESKPYILRNIYSALTNDHSSSRTTAEKEMDDRVQEALLAEDSEIVMDLRELNSNGKDKFNIFWTKCNEFLQTCTSVHERRHGTTTFMAKCISIRDLIDQVRDMCPKGTPIPSNSWVQYNFFPRNPRTLTAKQYKSRLHAKHMVQKRQYRKFHPDAHFCAALFRYIREYAILFRSISMFVCIDDKHRIKVGEPNFPVAAAERGREVIVSINDTLAVGDHDFTKFSLIPSVALVVDIPESMEGSWYTGDVFIGLKDAIYEASSAIRHAKELSNILSSKINGRSILFLYTDGGPDHRLTYISVQLSLIALFLNLKLDVLIAARTAPSHSWANPVERIMAIVNLGLQCVGLMREKMGDQFEKCVSNCKNLKQLRANCTSYKSDVARSLAPSKELLSSIVKRLQLHGRNFEIFESASESEIDSFWELLLSIDSSLSREDTTKPALQKLTELNNFISHCCVFRKYSITIKKCGGADCQVCKPVNMPIEMFSGKKENGFGFTYACMPIII